MKTAAQVLLGLLLGGLLIFGLNYYALGSKAFFAPKFEEVRRDTFEQSRAYREGLEQELLTLRLEYLKADTQIKPAIARLALHKAAAAPSGTLSPHTEAWLQQLKD